MNNKKQKSRALAGAGRPRRLLGPWIFLAATLCAPLALMGAMALNGVTQKVTLQESPAAVWVPAVEGKFKPIPVELSLKWSDGPALVAPQWGGLVTGISSPFPRDIRNGELIVQIDGVWRFALRTPSPFFRSLGPDSAGQDVSMLNDALSSLGLPSSPGETWTSRTAQGVKSLAKSLGINRGGDIFEPSWAVWLQDEVFSASATVAAVGQQAPSPGSPIIVGHPGLKVASANLGVLPDSSFAEKWTLNLEGQLLDYRPRDAEPLKIVETIASMFPEHPEKMKGTLSPASEIPTVSVPAASTVVDEDGNRCVFVLAPNRADPSPIGFSPLGGGAGQVLLPESKELTASTLVLLNPSDALKKPTCK